ncbi:sensor histidine kinase [Streptomyces sp. NPDC059378]|uniref:sensor histidine kinase n=1 Tax=Streptomyces sp. NPDC059378 TaxID=3346815 RepID=UPI0036806F28
MSWLHEAAQRADAPRKAVRRAWRRQRLHRQDHKRLMAEFRAARKAGKEQEHPGPPPSGFTLLPWLLMGMGAFSNLFQGETSNPWIGGLGLLTFNSLYIYVVFRAFHKKARESVSTRVALALLAAVTCALAIGYGGSWMLFFPLLGLATGAVLRVSHLRSFGTAVAVLAGVVSCTRDGWSGLNIAYATWISTMVTAAILSLSEAVRELRAAREELARRAVEKERLRFSRDLHDLLGHTLSVIVVKSEAARRLAPGNPAASLAQIADIESVGRQALTEIREAVTGYRDGSLATELDRARSALTAAGVEPSVRQSGPPLVSQAEALLGWVVREAVTNIVRHSDAAHCDIVISGGEEQVRLTVTDDGTGPAGAARSQVGSADGTCDGPTADGTPDRGTGRDIGSGIGRSRGTSTGTGTGTGTGMTDGATDGPGPEAVGGTGLKGLTERLAAAGGSLSAGPGPRGGFVVRAQLPVAAVEPEPDGVAAGA